MIKGIWPLCTTREVFFLLETCRNLRLHHLPWRNIYESNYQTMLKWQTLWFVRCFLGFTRLHKTYFVLTQLIKKDQPFVWIVYAYNVFLGLKKTFTSAPILAHVDSAKPFIIEADVSDFSLGSILSQLGDDKKLHPVAFHSRKFNAAEINYEIHDK